MQNLPSNHNRSLHGMSRCEWPVCPKPLVWSNQQQHGDRARLSGPIAHKPVWNNWTNCIMMSIKSDWNKYSDVMWSGMVMYRAHKNSGYHPCWESLALWNTSESKTLLGPVVTVTSSDVRHFQDFSFVCCWSKKTKAVCVWESSGSQVLSALLSVLY